MFLPNLMWALLLAALGPLAAAQDEQSDVKSIPLRTHSLQQVRGEKQDSLGDGGRES